MVERITVRAPATTANMGPGFDCLGMALDIWNVAHFEVGSYGFAVRGEDNEDLHPKMSNLVYRSFRLPFVETGRPVPRVSLTCENRIPLGRGLGSSSAAAVTGLMAGNELCGRPLSREDLLELATRIEGHPDNVAAALLGGCQIVVRDDDKLITSTVPVPRKLRAVLFVPEVPMSTNRARRLLGKKVDRLDAVYNIGRVALLVNAFSTGDLSHLAAATDDRLHQPARQVLFPPMRTIIRAAIGAGALGAFLSGAGSSVLALTSGEEEAIGRRMSEAALESGVEGKVIVTRPTVQGAQVLKIEQAI